MQTWTRVLPVAVAAAMSFAVRPAGADEIDRYIREQMELLRLPGVALAIVQDGRPLMIRTYGKANLETGTPVTRETVFELGSISKQLTAVAVLTLVDDGRLSLDDSARQSLPELPESWNDITVRHLLTHSAGLQEYLSIPGLPEEAHALSHPRMTPLLGERIRREFPAGATWAYSNTGYLLLSDILERVSGRPYFELMRERVFLPAGMHASGSTGRSPRLRAAGYGWTDGAFVNRAPLSGNTYGAGGIASTILDMVAWERALQRRALISNARYREMWTPLTIRGGATPPFSYGFGWVMDHERGHRAVLHSGGTPGFSTAIRRYVDEGLSVIVLANHGDRILDHVPMEVAGLVWKRVARARRAVDPDPDRSRRIRIAMRDLLAGKVHAERFTPAMRLFLATATGKGLWQWIASHGELHSLSYAQTERSGGNSTLRYRGQLGTARVWFSVTVTPAGEIAQIYWW